MTPDREHGKLTVIPNPYEEGLTPSIPGIATTESAAEFRPLPNDHFDAARDADRRMNRPISPDITVSENGDTPRF